MEDRAERRLIVAGCCSRSGSAVHIVDHLRRGRAASPSELYWAGNLALVVQVAVITLIFTRHRLAPLAAAAAGFPLALGFFAAHWLPEWSALSDPVWEIGALVLLPRVEPRDPGRAGRRRSPVCRSCAPGAWTSFGRASSQPVVT